MKRWRTYLFAGCCAVVLGACTGNFRDLNDDKSGITDKELEADDNGLGYRLGIVQQGVYFNYDYGKGKNWPFQMIQNLNADMFSGYMHDPKPLQGGSHNSDYNLQDGWNGSMWQFTYSYIMPEIYRLEQTAPEQKPAFYAIAKILKVLVMHRVTDYYGPVIYSHFGDRGNEYVPDSQEEVYGRFFDDLDEAETILTGAVRERKSEKRNNQTQTGANDIGLEAAKNAALADAGVSAADATFTEQKRDREDGVLVYDIDFYTATTKYEYEIDASTGAVREKKAESKTQTGDNGAYIGLERAKEIALSHAGLSAGEVYLSKAKFEDDDGVKVYEIEFYKDRMEYEYTIHAATGRILEFDAEYDD